MTEQVTDTLKDIALHREDANWMLKRLRRQQVKDRKRADQAIASIRENIADIDRQIQRLQNAYLNEVVSLEEFRSTKTNLVAKRAKLKENLTQADRDEATRLEPVEKFIKASRDAFSAAFGTNAAEKRDWLKIAGSNRQVLSGVLVFEPRGAWKIVATSTLQENRRQTRSCESDAYSREVNELPSKAVRVGFEPTVDRSLRRFSRSAGQDTQRLNTQELTDSQQIDWAPYWARRASVQIQQHPELTVIVDSWPRLPASQRQKLLSLVLQLT